MHPPARNCRRRAVAPNTRIARTRWVPLTWVPGQCFSAMNATDMPLVVPTAGGQHQPWDFLITESGISDFPRVEANCMMYSLAVAGGACRSDSGFESKDNA
jgi:hypothetical protein